MEHLLISVSYDKLPSAIKLFEADHCSICMKTFVHPFTGCDSVRVSWCNRGTHSFCVHVVTTTVHYLQRKLQAIYLLFY